MANTYEAQTWVDDNLQLLLEDNYGILSYANRKFEGTLKQKGDAVTVEEMPITTWSSAAADKAADYTRIDATATPYTITVSQGKTVNMRVAEIEEIQSAFNMKDSIVYRHLSGIKSLHTAHFLAQLAADAGNTVTTAALAVGTIHSKIEAMAVALSEDNAPEEGRILVVPPAAASTLRQSGIYVYTESGMDEIRAGKSTKVAGFSIVESNLGPALTMIGFVDQMSHFVSQMTKIEVNKLPENIGYALIGASYYQAKTVGTHTNCIVTHVYS